MAATSVGRPDGRRSCALGLALVKTPDAPQRASRPRLQNAKVVTSRREPSGGCGSMPAIASRKPSVIAALAIFAGLSTSVAVQASSTCPDERASRQVPTNLARCTELERDVRHPDGSRLKEYEEKLNEYLTLLCHRDLDRGWKVDKRIRDTGPWVGTYRDGKWSGQYHGTHAPVLIWYSPDFYKWLKTNRPNESAVAAQPVPDGAMIVKEMYTPPAAACDKIDPFMLLPKKGGAAVMVRDSKGAHDGWFWGWYGWGKVSGWEVDWPAK